MDRTPRGAAALGRPAGALCFTECLTCRQDAGLSSVTKRFGDKT